MAEIDTYRIVRRQRLGEIPVRTGKLFFGEGNPAGSVITPAPNGHFPVQVTHLALFNDDRPSFPYAHLHEIRVVFSDKPVAACEPVGQFACDAATAIVCDPRVGFAGVLPTEFSERDDELIERILDCETTGEVRAGGVYVSTGSDGWYTVWAQRSSDGAIAALVVDGCGLIDGDPAEHGRLESRTSEQETQDARRFDELVHADRLARELMWAAQDAAR